MKEKIALVILQSRNLQHGPYETAEAILAGLRCDTCVHWDHFEESVPVGSCDEVDRLTRPDFFCARWEDKTSV